MEPLFLPHLEAVEGKTTIYELPPEGISHLGYVVRRMHKTHLLLPIDMMLKSDVSDQALAQVAHYAAVSSASFGQIHYEPSQDELGTSISERDPETDAQVCASLESIRPESRVSFQARLPRGDIFAGYKKAETSTVSLRGWTRPAELSAHFATNDGEYMVELQGKMIREIVPRVAGPWKIRAHGRIRLHDSAGNTGQLILRRDASASLIVNRATQQDILQQELRLF